jgi:hypothetical protein
MQLSTVLSSYFGSRSFRRFCRHEHEENNVNFLEACREMAPGVFGGAGYGPIPWGTANRVQYLYDRFISGNATEQVNLNMHNQQTLDTLAHLGQLTIAAFLPAYREVFNTVESGVFEHYCLAHNSPRTQTRLYGE